MPERMPKLKITVLQKSFNADLVNEYFQVDPGSNYGACDQFRVGQEFVTDQPWSPPQGFCTWAWADLRGDIMAIMTGGDLPWMKERGAAIATCTDAFRPVIFKIERVK
jgi:uncharacterized repeat protein (TIGR04076 family)